MFYPDGDSSLSSAGVTGATSPRVVARFYSPRPDWDRYEREKLAFVVFNPNATPEQYEAAINAIAKRCGL